MLSCRDNTPAGLSVIHTGDRETDSYEFHARMALNQIRYVIRSHWDRVVSGEDATESSRISEQLAAAPWMETTRTVPLSARSGDRSAKDLKTNPPRNKRWATLFCRACSIEVRRPSHLAKNEKLPPLISMNVVEVLEREPGDVTPVAGFYLQLNPFLLMKKYWQLSIFTAPAGRLKNSLNALKADALSKKHK